MNMLISLRLTVKRIIKYSNGADRKTRAKSKGNGVKIEQRIEAVFFGFKIE